MTTLNPRPDATGLLEVFARLACGDESWDALIAAGLPTEAIISVISELCGPPPVLDDDPEAERQAYSAWVDEVRGRALPVLETWRPPAAGHSL